MIDEESLKAAAEELSLCQLQFLSTQEVETQVFSKKFERKMKRLIHKADYPVRHLFINVAAIFIAVLLALVALLSISPKVRAMVTKWIFNYTEGCVSCYHNGGRPAHEMPDYVLSQAPEGYRLWNVEYRSDGAEYLYVGPGNKLMSFCYYDGSETIQLHYSNPGLQRLEASLGENTANIYIASEKDRNNAIVWVDEETQVLFMIMHRGDQESLLRLAHSVNV